MDRLLIVEGRAMAGTEAQLHPGGIVNFGAAVDHYCEAGDFGRLCAITGMTDDAMLGPGAWAPDGAVLVYGVKIGSGPALEAGQALSKTRSQNANE